MSSLVPSTQRRKPWSEFLRVLILVAAALAVMSPFFTGNLIGGVDARWYGYMLADYIEQVRHGSLLVPVGQGTYAWNGAVHLFRSAPVYMAVARVWDFLTLRQLNPFALQHLTAITSAVAGTIGFYAAAVKVMPQRRWAAVGMALIYLASPSWLSTVLRSEAYMSYMAFAVLPLVLYGNARTALRDDGRGYVILGAGLALVWMCHPPIAFVTSVATLVIQSGLIMQRGIVSWRSMVAGAATFGVLSAYYFVSMSELPAQPHTHPLRSELAQILGFAAFFVGIGRFALIPGSKGWAIFAAVGAWAIWVTDYPWVCWAAATAGIWLFCVMVFRMARHGDFGRQAFVVLFLATLGGAACAEAWVGREGIFQGALMALSDNTAHFRDLFAPLSTPMRRIQEFQPGWALTVALAVAVGSLFGKRPPGAKLFFATALGLVVCFVRVPLVSNFLVGRFPVDLAAMCGVPLPLRITPLIASFTAMAAVIWISTANWSRPGTRRTIGLALAALVVWSGFQTVPFARHTHQMTSSAYLTDRSLRTENAMLDAYDYLLLPIPSYFSNGKTDPVLESRLLDRTGRVLVGPTEEAAVMEAKTGEKKRMVTLPIPNSTAWFEAGPRLTVNPQEHYLLRFEFDPDRNYGGFLMLEAEHAYREYHLPDSGQASAFGIGGNRTQVLSIWNSGKTPETYKFLLSTEPENDVPHSGAFFANLYISKLDVSALPISLESLIPYRARVTSDEPVTLETFRAYMPGYRASVDGSPAPVTESGQHLASVAVPAGVHEVELRFVGTAKLRFAAFVSGIAWAGLLGWLLYVSASRRRRGSVLLPA